MNNKNKNEMIKWSTRITSLFLSTITAVTMAGCKLNKNKSNENTITTTSISVESQNDPIIDNTSDSYKYTEKDETPAKEESYEELSKEFNGVIKKYPKEVQGKLKEVFNKAYSNYDNIYVQLKDKGVPRKGAFIKHVFIESLDKKVKSIEFLDPYGDDYDRAWEESDGKSYFEESTGKMVIMKEAGEIKDEDFLHEIIHATQTDLLKRINTTSPEYYIWGEGEAAAWAKMLISPTISEESQYLFGTDTKLYSVYGAGNSSYTVASKYYTQLLVLLGYNEMQQFKKNPSSSKIISALSTKYGIDGQTYYNDMQKVMGSAVNDAKEQNIDLLIKNDKTFKNCLMKKLSTLKDEKEIKDFFDVYRMMNIQYKLTYKEIYYKGYDVVCVDKTNSKIDNSDIENELFKKMNNIGAFNSLSTDAKEQRNIFDALLNPKADEYDSCIPYTLKNSNLSYDGKNVIISNENTTIVTNVNTKTTTRLNKQVPGYNIYIFSTQSEQKVR